MVEVTAVQMLGTFIRYRRCTGCLLASKTCSKGFDHCVPVDHMCSARLRLVLLGSSCHKGGY